MTKVPLIILRYYPHHLDDYTKSYVTFSNLFISEQNREQLFLGSNFIQICSIKILWCSVCQGLQNEPKFAQFGYPHQKLSILQDFRKTHFCNILSIATKYLAEHRWTHILFRKGMIFWIHRNLNHSKRSCDDFWINHAIFLFGL